MKKLTYIIVFFISFVFTNAQEKPNFRDMSPQQRREYIKSMSPEQRHKLMEDAAAMIAIKNLKIPAEKQEAFKKLFTEYIQSQKTIKDKFKPDFSKEDLSDAEAKRMLNQSFDLGQQLLNNRKVYAEKFLKILTPQQVLKLFNQEGKLREKFMDRQGKMGAPKARGPMPEDDFVH